MGRIKYLQIVETGYPTSMVGVVKVELGVVDLEATQDAIEKNLDEEVRGIEIEKIQDYPLVYEITFERNMSLSDAGDEWEKETWSAYETWLYL